MKKIVRRTMLLLALLLTLNIFIGCAEGKDPAANSETNATVTQGEGEAEVTQFTGELQPDIPADADFGGRDYIFLVRGEAYNEWQSQDIYVEEQTGEPIADAVYERNIYLEEKLNVKIKELQEGGSISAKASTSIQAGSHDFDIVMANTSESSSLASQNLIYNLHDIPYLDLSKEWWDQRSVSQLSMADRLYFMTGDLSIMANDATWIMMFNKNMVENFELDVPYDLVQNGTWTMAKMYEMMNIVAADVDGDGVRNHAVDRFGFATHGSSYEGFFFGSGSHITAKDADDMPYLDMNSERLIGLIELTGKIMSDRNITPDLTLGATTDLQAVFEGGRSLFYGEVMQCIIRLRAMEIDFGVIPFPKYDDTQESYNHFIHTTACMVSVPLMNDELEDAGIMLEAMAAKSKYTLQPAYYDICLDGKFMRDEESTAMLDIILDARNFDIGYIYGWGGLMSAFTTCASTGNTDFASKYATLEKVALKSMDKTLDQWLTDY